MPLVNRVRHRAVRAILSALAGGGLTAAGLGGPLAATALGGRNTPTGANAGEVNGSSATEGAPESGTSTTPTVSTETTTTPTSTTSGESSETTSTETTTTDTLTTPTTGTSAPSGAAPVPSKPSAPSSAEAPTVVLKRKQKATSAPSRSRKKNRNASATHGTAKSGSSNPAGTASGPNNVAASPQAVAAEAGLLAAMLASSEASAEALTFYRIPLFLLPIYKAAAVQYGVPWQILAAINEIETDYGSDLSVSTAGAVGWMQFMPSTWLQYGVDALNAGYADPYNPVDAVFAAARYLRAAGAATNLSAAIFSYNHSSEYVESVLLRAKLISSYPSNVIATLTGLVDGRLPVTGTDVSWGKVWTQTISAGTASATAGARPVAAAPAGTPGSTPPLAPAAAAAAVTAKAANAAKQLQLVELIGAPNASVVAVQDGRVMQIGDSPALGRFLVLRDVDGDVFTYAGLGSIAPTYVQPKPAPVSVKSPAVEAASTPGPTPSQPASAGTQPPVTLQVKAPVKAPATGAGLQAGSGGAQEEASTGTDRRRVYAHPGNPDARAAAAVAAASRTQVSKAGRAQPLRVGSVISSGTVLGRVSVPPGAQAGHLRFAVRPAGDPQTVNPGPVLENWAQLQKALHPQGAKATNALLGATASGVFLMSKSQLERAVLSDPGISLGACARHEVAAGVVDKRVLAVLAFLSRSGLEPTVSALRCSEHRYAASASLARSYSGEEVDISAINGTAIAGHQGSETITELTIRTLLSLPAAFVPHEIVSLMRFPGAHNTYASAAYWNRIHLEFNTPAPPTRALNPAAAQTAAHSAGPGATAPAPTVSATSALDALQWSQLIVRAGALPAPVIPSKPTSASIPDPKRP